MTAIAVIIARAGSKGLKNKSMQPLLGKPVIAWTIEHALGSKRLNAVALTSDCPQIREVGSNYGIECFERPAELAADSTTIDAAVRYGVERWESAHNKTADYIAILYGNIPVRPADLADRALQKLIETEADSVQSVYPVGKMHPLWMRKLTGPFGDVLSMYEPNRIYRRQELSPTFMLDAGALVVTRQSLFSVDPNEPHAFLGHDCRAIVTQPGEVVDVDDELDLAWAELLLKRKLARNAQT